MTPEQMLALIMYISDAVNEPRPTRGRTRHMRTVLFDAFDLDIDANDFPAKRPPKYCPTCGGAH